MYSVLITLYSVLTNMLHVLCTHCHVYSLYSVLFTVGSEAKVDVNKKCQQGFNPLLTAAMEGVDVQ